MHYPVRRRRNIRIVCKARVVLGGLSSALVETTLKVKKPALTDGCR